MAKVRVESRFTLFQHSNPHVCTTLKLRSRLAYLFKRFQSRAYRIHPPFTGYLLLTEEQKNRFSIHYLHCFGSPSYNICTTSKLKCWLILIFWAIYDFNFKNFMFVEKSHQCFTNQKVVLKLFFGWKEKHEYMQNLISDWIMFLFFSICFLLRHFLVSLTSKVVHLFFGWKEKSLPIQL